MEKRKGITILLFLLSLSVLSGCATISGGYGDIVKDYSVFDDKMAASTVKLGKQILQTWDVNSGFWRVQIGGKITSEDYYRVRIAMDNLDRLAEKQGTITKREAGEAVAWWSRFISAGSKEMFEEAWPKILALIAKFK